MENVFKEIRGKLLINS